MKVAGGVRLSFDSVAESVSPLFQSITTEGNCANMRKKNRLEEIRKRNPHVAAALDALINTIASHATDHAAVARVCAITTAWRKAAS